MKGLILAGGESKRAGTDKGLKLKDNKPWVILMRQKLIELGLDVKVSINQTQLLAYKNYINEDDLILDRIEINGPLKAFLSAYINYLNDDWMVLACDLIDMRIETISNIIKVKNAHPSADFYVYKNGFFFEPLCGIYTSKGLAKLYNSFVENKLNNYSLQQVLKDFETYALPVEGHTLSFNNYNK